MKSREYCATCKFWNRQEPTVHTVDSDSEKGAKYVTIHQAECRRSPPFLDPDPLRLRGLWPQTYRYSWCGEYQLAPQAGDGQLAIKGEGE